jgi:molecular chaperone DnaK (HSP70)
VVEPDAGPSCVDRCLQRPSQGCPVNRDVCALACQAGQESPTLIGPTLARPRDQPRVGPAAVLGATLSIETLGGVSTALIPKCTRLPANKVETFSTASDNQTSVEIRLVAGEAARATENRSLGRFRVEGIPRAVRGIPQIELTLHVDASGVLSVSGQDRITRAVYPIRVTPSP